MIKQQDQSRDLRKIKLRDIPFPALFSLPVKNTLGPILTRPEWILIDNADKPADDRLLFVKIRINNEPITHL